MFCLRPRSSLALVFALVCAMFAVAPSTQTVRAASTVFVVNSASDPYPADNKCDPVGTGDGCTLRDALNLANSAPVSDTIEIDFNIPRGVTGYYSEMVAGFFVETWTITLTQALPVIDHDNITVDGTTQENYLAGTSNPFGPTVIINGSQLSTNSSGLTIRSNNNIIKNLGVINFRGNPGVGIDIRQRLVNNVVYGNGNTVQGCYLGINRLGTVPAANNYGVWIRSSNNLIGGRTSLQGQLNVISGNLFDGVRIEDGTSNAVQGNYIGLNAQGALSVPNNNNGIFVYFSDNNTIGSAADDTNATHANIISGNTQNGVLIDESNSNLVAGNIIGLNTVGAGALANGGDGVRIESAASSSDGNKIGSTNQSGRNIISGNVGAGIHITGNNTSATQVMNNLIGPKADGTLLTGNIQKGVVVDGGADGSAIGGTTAGQGNVISGNLGGDGILFSANMLNGEESRGNSVTGNIIGLNSSKQGTLGNNGRGIILSGNIVQTVIGGAGNAGNIIANNTSDGIRITGAKPVNTTISGNTIRLNGGDGITVVNGTNVTTTTLSNNYINLNVGDGVQISGANNTLIFSNTIGMGSGDALGNGIEGIRMTNSFSATVQANKVIGNNADGVRMASVQTARLLGNTVNQNDGKGFDVIDGSRAISITSNTIYSNTEEGVFVGVGESSIASQQVQITDNSISANGNPGINLEPDTIGLPGLASNPNHDIDAPFGIHVNQDGLLTGRVYGMNQPASCSGCLIQIFGTSPELRDGQGKTKINAPVEISSNGYFTATVGSIPSQLALTATDRNGNTSEFGVFDATFGLAIGPPRTGTAAPGDTITYTHRITNTGTVDFTDLQLSAVSNKGWTAKVVPPAPIALAAGQSKPVTLTLTLPKAPNSTVLAGTVDLTRVTVRSSKIGSATASVTDTTTVASAFKLEVVPPSISGIVVPGGVLTYTHTLRNIGNLTGTLVLSASTTPNWTTIITPTTITLGPGQEKPVNIGVQGSKEGAKAGTQGKTTVGIRVTSPLGQPPVYITDTTTIALEPLVTIVPNNDKRASPGQTITVEHIVTNNSNGPIKLRLASSSPRNGSDPRTSYIITFRSATPGVTLGSDNSFTLGTSDTNKQLQLLVDIRVPDNAPVGASDDIYISLYQDTGVLVGSVTDTVRVIAPPLKPQAYLPLIQQYYDLSNTTPTP